MNDVFTLAILIGIKHPDLTWQQCVAAARDAISNARDIANGMAQPAPPPDAP